MHGKTLAINKSDRIKTKATTVCNAEKQPNGSEKDAVKKDIPKVLSSKVRKKPSDVALTKTAVEKTCKSIDTSAIKASRQTNHNGVDKTSLSPKPAQSTSKPISSLSKTAKLASASKSGSNQLTTKQAPATSPVTVIHIKSVLKKPKALCTNDDDGDDAQTTVAAAPKSVQFGPKFIREVTKIVYPWNADHSSSSEDDDTAADDDDDTTVDGDDDTTVDDDDDKDDASQSDESDG